MGCHQANEPMGASMPLGVQYILKEMPLSALRCKQPPMHEIDFQAQVC